MSNNLEPVVEYRRGDILKADDLDAIVNPVNCVGVMGKGLARQFASRYPQIVTPYRDACHTGKLTTERCFIQTVSREGSPQYIVNLATKEDWRNPSRIEWIEAGMHDMYRQLEERGVWSVGIPALGAGLGGLRWQDVQEVIESRAKRNPKIRTVVFTPNQQPPRFNPKDTAPDGSPADYSI